MDIILGSPALSAFRIEKISQSLEKDGIKVKSINTHYVHLVDTKEPFTSENDYSKPTDSDINIKEPSTFKIERKTSKIISTEPSISSKVTQDSSELI